MHEYKQNQCKTTDFWGVFYNNKVVLVFFYYLLNIKKIIFFIFLKGFNNII